MTIKPSFICHALELHFRTRIKCFFRSKQWLCRLNQDFAKCCKPWQHKLSCQLITIHFFQVKSLYKRCRFQQRVPRVPTGKEKWQNGAVNITFKFELYNTGRQVYKQKYDLPAFQTIILIAKLSADYCNNHDCKNYQIANTLCTTRYLHPALTATAKGFRW